MTTSFSLHAETQQVSNTTPEISVSVRVHAPGSHTRGFATMTITAWAFPSMTEVTIFANGLADLKALVAQIENAISVAEVVA